MSGTLINLIIQIIAGVVGGHERVLALVRQIFDMVDLLKRTSLHRI
jgi:hypothetical protein